MARKATIRCGTKVKGSTRKSNRKSRLKAVNRLTKERAKAAVRHQRSLNERFTPKPTQFFEGVGGYD